MTNTPKYLVWSSIDKFGVQAFALLVGLFAVRMLSPKDFGTIACLAIFTSLSNVLVDSGMSAALIRRENNTNNEYSASFIFNILLSIVLYVILWFFSDNLAEYFNVPELNPLSRFLFLAIIINSFGLIQNIILTKEMRFKEISIANITSAIVSAITTVVLILCGYTYWAIAWQIISLATARVLMLWFFSNWHPFYKPDFMVIKKVFSFSAFLLFTSVINIFVKYIYNLKIPKYFSDTELGYYDRAKKFQDIPPTIVASAISSVAYPILASLKDDTPKMRLFFRKLIRINAFLIFPIMFGLIAVINNATLVLFTEKWLPMVPYFQILCAASIFFPFQNMALTTLNAMGKSNLNFMLELLRNTITLILFVLLSTTIQQMLFGFTIAMFIAYIANIIVIGKKLKYSFLDHIKDIAPYALISSVMFLLIFFIDKMNIVVTSNKTTNLIFVMFIQIFIGGAFYLTTSYILGSKIIKDSIELFSHIKNKK